MNSPRVVSRIFGDKPWFRVHRQVAVGVAAVLYAAVLALTLTVSHAEEVAMLYALPVALLAVAYGRRGGAVGAGIGVVMSAVPSDSVLGWMAGAVAMVLLGLLLGDATDRIIGDERRERRHALDQEHFDAERRRHEEALRLHDSVVQGIAAGIWMLDVGSTEQALEALTSTMGVAQQLVSELLGSRQVVPGNLVASTANSPH